MSRISELQQMDLPLQLDLQLQVETAAPIVNVASVPQRSPFRYPGGKTWLVPYIRQWLGSRRNARPASFIEPFAGGGSVSLTVTFERLAEQVTMVELDELVASVWRTILEGDAQWLAARIEQFEFTVEQVDKVLKEAVQTCRDCAFQTVLKNRVNRGGILAAGAGRIKEGECGKGLKSRWYPETLARRIRNIDTIRERIRFIEGDGLRVLQENYDRGDAVFFIDPPYTAAGKKAGSRLYTYSKLDHNELFRIAATLHGDFLMTYDNTEEVNQLAIAHGFETQTVAMKNTHHAQMRELLIGKNLAWLQHGSTVSIRKFG